MARENKGEHVAHDGVGCLQYGNHNEVVFVNDDPFDKAEMIGMYMKTHDRVLFVDFGIQIDDLSLQKCFDKHEGVGCLVFPGVLEGVDWDMFKTKVKSNSKEPVDQMGLNFDTQINKRPKNIGENKEISNTTGLEGCSNSR